MFDTGWVVHGTLNAGKMQTFRESGVAADEMAPPAFADRSLHLWDPRAKWLLQLQPMAFGLFVLVIGCAAFLTFDVGDGWRWAAGAVGILGLVGASGNPADGQSQPA
ncbi:hypothetical protein [Streptomyces zinciresistens]|uniref:hypothetical protein n=1 Tax=Streptomyces zinciresistens TaxID=1073330 RepID=UPI001112A833|nr:hypothetical protein [Streptomyces zinciresistens]